MSSARPHPRHLLDELAGAHRQHPARSIPERLAGIDRDIARLCHLAERRDDVEGDALTDAARPTRAACQALHRCLDDQCTAGSSRARVGSSWN